MIRHAVDLRSASHQRRTAALSQFAQYQLDAAQSGGRCKRDTKCESFASPARTRASRQVAVLKSVSRNHTDPRVWHHSSAVFSTASTDG